MGPGARCISFSDHSGLVSSDSPPASIECAVGAFTVEQKNEGWYHETAKDNNTTNKSRKCITFPAHTVGMVTANGHFIKLLAWSQADAQTRCVGGFRDDA